MGLTQKKIKLDRKEITIVEFMTLPALLRGGREKIGLTQTKAAAKLGVTQTMVSRWERGDTTPGVKELGRLIKLYELDQDNTWSIYRESIERASLKPIEREVLRCFHNGDLERLINLVQEHHLKTA